jgi:AraC-like DNA-binding protein
LYRAQIAILNKNYSEALALCEESYRLCAEEGDDSYASIVLNTKALILSKMGRSEESFATVEQYIALRDSLEKRETAVLLNDLRSLYETDKIIAEKETVQNYLLFALVGCLLLIILLAIWIYYSRLITKKNRVIVNQIRELQKQPMYQTGETLRKIFFEPVEEADNTLCPTSRSDELCLAIRDLIFKEKVYRDSMLTRDDLIRRLGTNKALFMEAFSACFGASFPEYINNLRLKDAIILLEQSDTTMEEISEKVGFGTVRTFRRQFQAKYNVLPKEYRNSIKKSV